MFISILNVLFSMIVKYSHISCQSLKRELLMHAHILDVELVFLLLMNT